MQAMAAAERFEQQQLADHFVKEALRVPAYLRYADDFRLFSEHKEELHAHRRSIEGFLAGLRLVMHDRKTQLQPCAAGVPFFGFTLYPSGRRTLQRRTVRSFRKRLRTMARDLSAGLIDQDTVSASVRAWLAHAAHANAHRLSKQILSEVTFRCGPRSS